MWGCKRYDREGVRNVCRYEHPNVRTLARRKKERDSSSRKPGKQDRDVADKGRRSFLRHNKNTILQKVLNLNSYLISNSNERGKC